MAARGRSAPRRTGDHMVEARPEPDIAAAGYSVSIVTEVGEWDALAPAWDTLFDASPTASPPLRFAWLRTWWRVYGEEYGGRRGGLRIVTVRRGGELVGALPLYERDRRDSLFPIRRVGFLSTGEAADEAISPDYLDLLYRPGDEGPCVRGVRRAVGRMRWDRLEMPDMSAESPLVRRSADVAGTPGFQGAPSGSCPV